MARYIDADKLLSELQEELEFETPMYTEEQNECFNSGVKCAIRDVKSIPTADVAEVKHGVWAKQILFSYGNGVDIHQYTCSHCNSEFRDDHIYIMPVNFCPNCGAKMDGGETHG